jgi:hypothetical protein
MRVSVLVEGSFGVWGDLGIYLFLPFDDFVLFLKNL